MRKTVLPNKYAQYLEICKNIKSVQTFETGDVSFEIEVNGEQYSIMLMALSDYKMPIVYLCNPKDGESNKPHQQYIRKYDLVHLCLSVRDDISVKNKDYREIIDYTLARVLTLLSLSEQEEEKEFRKEFLYFWNYMATNKEKVALYIDTSNAAKRLCIHHEKEKMIVLDPIIELNSYFLKKYSLSQTECLYIPVVNTKGILPPLNNKPWSVEELQYILEQCISETNATMIEEFEINTNRVFVVFEMNIPDTLPISLLIEVQYNKSTRGNIYRKLKDIRSITHWSSQRCDHKYLFKRIGIDIRDTNKKALVIGAGSLGSYIIKEMPQIGYESITIYDKDDLSYENIMRHRLGALYAYSNKAFAMKFDLELSYPNLKVDYFNKKFCEDDIVEKDLDNFDIIIIATGGTDFMLGLNRKFKTIGIKKPVVFAWIEAMGTGVHSLLVDYSKQGCFQCLYTDSEINKAHYAKQEQEYHNVGTGCGSVFNAYGNLTLLKGSAMILELIIAATQQGRRFDLNPLYSVRTKNIVKDKDFVISRRDFEVTNHFYVSERCEVCGLQVQE